jgi:hypothetical protein
MSFSWFNSVDDDLIEPAGLWQDQLPAKWRDTGPRIVRDGGSEFWAYAVAGLPGRQVRGQHARGLLLQPDPHLR